MFGGKDVVDKEYILNRISEFQIFKYYCHNFESLNKPFLSEFYIDTKPSCRIRAYNQGLYYKDFGTGDSYNCFEYVMMKFKCTYKECLSIIASDFKLINKIKDVIPSINYLGYPDKKFGVSKTVILCKFRQWYKFDTYFEDYHITRDILDRYYVTPLEIYWLEKSGEMFPAYKFKENIFDPAYSYEEGDNLRKILRPYNKEYKWTSNVPRRYYQGYKQLDNTGDILIVTSSLKDVMVWRLFGFNAICPTGETVLITENAYELLKYRFKNIIINYDNDEQGIKSSNQYLKVFDTKTIFIPEFKDISDYIYFKGYDSTKNLIKNLI